MIEPENIEKTIISSIPDAIVVVNSNDNVHFYAEVTSSAFIGKTLIQQHRMVLDVLKLQIKSEEIHAISIKTFKRQPAEVSQQIPEIK